MSLDDQVADIARRAVNDHLANHPHLTAIELEALIRRVVDEHQPTPPQPPEPPQPDPDPRLIPLEEWTVYADPTRPEGFNRFGQFSTAGNLWQANGTRDVLNAGPGFGLTINNDWEIHSTAEGGDTLRFGARPGPDLGRPAWLSRQVWRGTGYDPAREQANGVNLSVAWPESDRTRFDGTRTDYSCVPVGPDDPRAVAASTDGTGDQVLACSVLRVEPWMMGNHLCAHDEVHAKYTPRSPFTMFTGQGKLRVTTRTQTQPWADGDSHPPNRIAGSADLTPHVGSWIAVVHDYRVDPVHGHYRAWLNADGQWFALANQTGGFGYTYHPGDTRTGEFFVKLVSTYGWHNDNKFTGHNWDPAYGWLRESWFAWSGAIIGTDMEASRMGDHCEAILP